MELPGDVDSIAAQLAPQLSGCDGTLIVTPSVGFGAQSHRALPQTLHLLATVGRETSLTVVFLVNRPRHQQDDGSDALIRRLVSTLPSTGTRFAIARHVVDGRPQMGTLRQLAHDAAVACLGGAQRVPFSIVADDDFVHAPPGYVARLTGALLAAPEAGVAIGPVLFDDPQLPSIRFPDFFIADVVRALLAARWAAQFAADGGADDAWTRYAESIALSGNLAVRTTSLRRAGGFQPLNEITRLVQSMDRLAKTSETGRSGAATTWDFNETGSDVIESLMQNAVRLSSRRALRAYLDHGLPPVAQWRACRFHASRIDPARMGMTTRLPTTWRRDDAASMAALRQSTARLLATTLACFPADHGTARCVLDAVGLDAQACTVTFDPDLPTPWRVEIHDERPMLARIDQVRPTWLAASEPLGRKKIADVT